MTPAILLVTLSLYNQPASNSQTKFASMEDCQAARTKMLMDEQRSRDKARGGTQLFGLGAALLG